MKERKPGSGKPIGEEVLDAARPTVVKLCRIGCSVKEIGGIIGMSDSSINRHFVEELAEGRSHMKASLRKAQINAAINDRNPTMLIWLGKCYLDQKEPKYNIEHSGGITVEKVIFKSAKESIPKA